MTKATLVQTRLLEDLETVRADKDSLEYLLRERLEQHVQSRVEARVSRMLHQVRTIAATAFAAPPPLQPSIASDMTRPPHHSPPPSSLLTRRRCFRLWNLPPKPKGGCLWRPSETTVQQSLRTLSLVDHGGSLVEARIPHLADTVYCGV